MADPVDQLIEFRRLTGHIGAELLDFDLLPFNQETFDVLHDALLEHQVVFIPGQFLGPEDLLSVALVR